MSTNLARSAFWITVSEIIYNLSGFIIHSAVGRILGPADYGRFGLVITLTTMVIILIGNGIPTAMNKYISEIFDTNPLRVKVIKRQTIILQSLLIGSITIIFYLSAPLLSRALGDPTLTPLFRFSTLIIPVFAAASFYFSYFTGLHRFNIQSALKISRSFFRLFFIILLAYYFGIKGSIAGYIAAPALVFFIAFLIDKLKVSRELKTIPAEREFVPSFEWRKLINYAWQIILFFLAYELLISIDLYLVKGILRNDYLTGIYNASLTIGRIPYYIFYALTVILLPVISKSTSQNNSEKTTQIINNSLHLMLILLVPMIILMNVFAGPIIELFYSSRYAEAAYPMSILVWGVGFLTIYYVFCFVMNGAGKVKKPMVLSILGLVLNTILNYFFIKKYGLPGSAMATSIASFVIAIIMLYYVWKDFGVAIKLKSLARIFLAGGVMYFTSFLFEKDGLIFILWSSLLFAFYIFLLYLLKEIKKEDLLTLKTALSSKRKK